MEKPEIDFPTGAADDRRTRETQEEVSDYHMPYTAYNQESGPAMVE